MKIARVVLAYLGDPPNYVEPFYGSGAVHLLRPEWDWQVGYWRDGRRRLETINDLDCLVVNFWRAVRADPDQVAYWADWPVAEADLIARHFWLIERRESLYERCAVDPDWYDAKYAGWWLWGICQWIGSDWCKPGTGPWQIKDGKLIRADRKSGVSIGLPSLRNPGKGVLKSSILQGDIPSEDDETEADESGAHIKRPNLSRGMGIMKAPPVSRGGLTKTRAESIKNVMRAYSDRMRDVRITAGDWSRVVGPVPTVAQGITGVFLDPPYSESAARYENIYVEDDLQVAVEVRKWAIENGDDPRLRIALCGYEGEHDEFMPSNWTKVNWKTQGGYAWINRSGRGVRNRTREVVWFSPHCVHIQGEMFAETKLFNDE
jgi:hypothetical protein